MEPKLEYIQYMTCEITLDYTTSTLHYTTLHYTTPHYIYTKGHKAWDLFLGRSGGEDEPGRKKKKIKCMVLHSEKRSEHRVYKWVHPQKTSENQTYNNEQDKKFEFAWQKMKTKTNS